MEIVAPGKESPSIGERDIALPQLPFWQQWLFDEGQTGAAVDLTLDKLAIRNCRSCKGILPMSINDAELTLKSLPSWKLLDNRIEKEYKFKTYLEGLDFANKIGHIAEEQDHHPDILIGWRRVTLTLTTHSIKGLSENDFIMAAKADMEYASPNNAPAR